MDTILLKDLRTGSEEAYERFVSQFESSIYRFFVLSHGDPGLAQEQCVETFGNFVFALPKMRGDSNSIRPFLFGIAKNVLRKSWSGKRTEPLSEELLAQVPIDAPSPFERVAGKAEFRQAVEAIQLLEEPGRQVMILRFVEEFKMKEIAEALEMPLNTVKSHIHRCTQMLVERLAPKEEARW